MIRLETDNTSTLATSSTTASKEANTKFTSKSSGRWTKEEHQKFVEGLRKFGKNWKQVEEFVGTRNGAQIRSHAQKFFNRLEREYNVKLSGGKTTNSKKKGKDSFTKESEGSLSTYNSGQDNASDGENCFDLLKDDLNKVEPIIEEPKVVEAPQPTPVTPQELPKPAVTQDQVKDMIKDVLLICQKQVSPFAAEKPLLSNGASFSLFDIISKINQVGSTELKIQVPRLSDLVAMPMAQRPFVNYEKIPSFTTNPIKSNFTCSFRISSSFSQDQNIDKKLKLLRKPEMYNDDFLRKKIKTC